jgi:hypothetical protein
MPTEQDQWMVRVVGVQFPAEAAGNGALPAAVAPPAQPALSDAACLKLIRDCGSSWKTVKKTYLADKATMGRLVAYRKSVVDGIIRELDKQWSGRLIAKAIGSTNLTSDYDITFTTTDGDGSEIDAVVSFNDEIKRMFGVPPGVCFDTNLYVKDFLDVEDKTILGTENAPRADRKPIDPIETLLAMDRSDQDVGALTKQRQYMNVEQWTAYRGSVLSQMQAIKDPAAREKAVKEAETQFSEAESTYLLKAAEKIERLFAQIDQTTPPPSPALIHMQALREQWGKEAGTERAHALADEILHEAAEHFEPQAMEANNELYMQKMFAARDIQAKQKALEKLLAAGNPPTKSDGTPDVDGSVAKDTIDALKTRAKKEITDANFFAAEAYLSEGPLQHIVSGMQGGNADALARLRPDHLLGSINEQFGDFMKDCSHYASDEGEAFCQTSKYVERMLNGIVLLRTKPEFAALTLRTLPVEQVETMAGAIKTKLLPIRGAKDAWADKSDMERFAAAGALAHEVYGVSTMAALQSIATKLSVEINAAVRATISANGGMRPSDKDNAKFFANRGYQPHK